MLSSSAAFLQGDAEKLYPVAMVTMALITWFGPLTAERTFDCRMEHKLPLVLIPSILAMGAAAY